MVVENLGEQEESVVKISDKDDGQTVDVMDLTNG